MLIDSNIIIYSFSDEYRYLRNLLVHEQANISEISRVEVLGYHKLKDVERKYFSDIFTYTSTIIPNREIFDKAIEIRQQYNLNLGDSIIAATALIYDLTVYTRNLKDFEHIKMLKTINPVR